MRKCENGYDSNEEEYDTLDNATVKAKCVAILSINLGNSIISENLPLPAHSNLASMQSIARSQRSCLIG